MQIDKNKLKIMQIVSQKLDIPIYLVGGAVRDILLNKIPKDWDFTTPILPDEIEKAIKNAGYKPYSIGKKFGTIGCKIPLDNNHFEYVEITTFRSEKYSPNNRKPEVEFITNIDEDLARRDFSINAIAVKENGKVIDNWNGLEDLQNGLIKAVGNPKIRFKEDPLRLLRAVRFATVLNGKIEEKTWQKMCSGKLSLLNVSKERWVLELDKILIQENVTKGLNLLMDSGLLGVIIPELSLQKNYNQNSPHHDFSLWEHTVKVVANTPKEDISLRWSALLHDIAKPFVRTENKKGYSNYIGHEVLGAEISNKICDYLKFSKERKNTIVDNILHHLEPNSNLKIYDDNGKKV